MKFFLACMAWVVMAALIGLGIWLLVAKGVVWVFALVTLAFFVVVGKVCAVSH